MAYGYVAIYAIQDPQTKRVFYVGRSKRPQARFMQHMTEANQYREKQIKDNDPLWFESDNFGKMTREREGNIKKLKWINSIQDRGLEPEFVILDEWQNALTEEDANRFEDAWIAIMRGQKQPLVNVLYSRRMSPSWYGEKNPHYKAGWAKTPEEYIARLKAGTAGSARQQEHEQDRDQSDGIVGKKKYSISQRMYFARRNARAKRRAMR